jgi:polyhydroxyalkanoate synthesis regulator phasin
MSDVDELRARIEELERRVEILFQKTGAIDMEELARGTEEPSPEVRELVAKGEIKQAVKLYQEQTGADMAATMGALGKLKRN